MTFADGTDMPYALQQVQARVNQVQGELPAGLDVQVERLTPSLFPILSYNLEGGDPATLYDIAQYQVRPLLSRVPGVGRVDVQASDVREMRGRRRPGAARRARHDVRGSRRRHPAGHDRQRRRAHAVELPAVPHRHDDRGARRRRTSGGSSSGAGCASRDVARVIPGTEDHVRIVAGDGRPAALLNITRQQGGNTVAIADSVAAVAAALRRTLPPGVRLTPVYDQAALVRDAVTSVRDAMLIGAALAIVVLLLFLRHARITAISASAIPLTMAITVFVMARLGQTFNLMTLGAMAIAIGLVIDDAVVVTENIVRHLHLTADRTTAVRDAVQELIWPVTTSTITTVVVFLPLGLLTGVEGQFFHALSITLTIAVLVSLVLALTLIPLLAAQFLTAADAERTVASGQDTGLLARLGHRLDAMSDRYERSLGAALHRARLMLVVAVALVIAGVTVHRFVGSGFLPEMDEGAFVLDYTSPGGTALAETDRMVHVVERLLARTPEVAGTSRRTGAELGLFATEQNTGDIAVRLAAHGARDRTSFQVIDEVRGKVEAAVPRLRVEFVQILSDVINDLAGAASPVEVKLFGTDLAALEAYGTALGAQLAKVDGVEDLYDGVAEPSAEMSMTIDAVEANRIGLTPDQVSAQVAGALLGADAGEVRLSDRSVGIRVRAPDSVRFDPQRLGALPIVSPTTGRTTALATLASFRAGESRSQLLRENQQQMIDVTADITGRSLGAIMNDVKAVVARTPPPAGIRLELAGQYASQQAAFRALLLVLAIAGLSVIAVMVVQFESFVEPLVVLLAAPLSFVGAMALLLVTGTPLNVSSFMGLILLVGLIVKNGIILLDFTRHRMRTAGLALEPAIREAARIRLRPILMTTLCTLFGLLPLALGLGAGSELQRPLALAVIGGLALSTPITLYVVPTLLVALRGRDFTLAAAPAPTDPHA